MWTNDICLGRFLFWGSFFLYSISDSTGRFSFVETSLFGFFIESVLDAFGKFPKISTHRLI